MQKNKVKRIHPGVTLRQFPNFDLVFLLHYAWRLGSNDSSHEVSDSNFEILDSTEQAVEHSLASTGRANVRAMKIYSESSKTTCFTWLAIFAMTCIFIMVVLLIRVT
nr:hypothetical protein CFP56_02252 [Quercus suber]